MVRLGQHLQQERQKKHLSIEEVSQATKIKSQFLSAIEKGEYVKLPSPAYAAGFVRNYISFLGLPEREMLALFRREFDSKKAYKVLPEGFSQKKTFPLHHLRMQQSLIIGIGILLLIVGYLLFQYRGAIFPPSLSVTTPQEHAVVEQAVVVTGKTESDATVFVNTDLATVDDNGNFTKTLSLFPGKAEVVIKARNSFGKETIVTRDIVVKE